MSKLSQQTVGGKLVMEVSADPSLSAGLAAPIGSIALFNDGTLGHFFLKTASADTAWSVVASGAAPSDWLLASSAAALNVVAADAYFGTFSGNFDIHFYRNNVSYMDFVVAAGGIGISISKIMAPSADGSYSLGTDAKAFNAVQANNLIVTQGGSQFGTLKTDGSTNVELAVNQANLSIKLTPNGTGHVDVSSKQVKNLADPSADQDAVSRIYSNRYGSTFIIPSVSTPVIMTSSSPKTMGIITGGTGAQLIKCPPDISSANGETITIFNYSPFLVTVQSSIGVAVNTVPAGMCLEVVYMTGWASSFQSVKPMMNGTTINVASSNLQNVLDPVLAQDASTKHYTDLQDAANLVTAKAYTDAMSLGLKPKLSVRAGSLGANIAIASALINGLVLDGVTLVTGDRVLLKDQTLPQENGVYIVVASGAAPRASDMNSLSPIDQVNMSWLPIQEGSQAGEMFVQYGHVATLGTSPINFEFYNPLASAWYMKPSAAALNVVTAPAYFGTFSGNFDILMYRNNVEQMAFLSTDIRVYNSIIPNVGYDLGSAANPWGLVHSNESDFYYAATLQGHIRAGSAGIAIHTDGASKDLTLGCTRDMHLDINGIFRETYFGGGKLTKASQYSAAPFQPTLAPVVVTVAMPSPTLLFADSGLVKMTISIRRVSDGLHLCSFEKTVSTKSDGSTAIVYNLVQDGYTFIDPAMAGLALSIAPNATFGSIDCTFSGYAEAVNFNLVINVQNDMF